MVASLAQNKKDRMGMCFRCRNAFNYCGAIEYISDLIREQLKQNFMYCGGIENKDSNIEKDMRTICGVIDN